MDNDFIDNMCVLSAPATLKYWFKRLDIAMATDPFSKERELCDDNIKKICSGSDEIKCISAIDKIKMFIAEYDRIITFATVDPTPPAMKSFEEIHNIAESISMFMSDVALRKKYNV